MGAFDTIDIGATGVGLGRVWMDTIAHNLANLNTVRPGDAEPFRAGLVLARERDGRAGVEAVGVLESGGAPALVMDPSHPMADAEGRVALPVIDMSGQMSDLLIANRSYQANLRVIQAGREAYETALQIGRA